MLKNGIVNLKEFFVSKNERLDDYLLKHLHHPAPRSTLLPYRFYNKEERLFYMQNNITGFVLQADPMVGCDENIYKQISLLFDDHLPFGSVLEVTLVASDDISKPIMSWQNGGISNNEIYQKLREYRSSFLHSFNSETKMNFRLRDYQLYFSYSILAKKQNDIKKVIEFRDRLQTILHAINIRNAELGPEGLLRLVKEFLNYPDYHTNCYNEHELLSNQICDVGNSLLVEEDNILLSGGEYIARCYRIDKYPEDFSISRMPYLLGSRKHDNLQIPGRYALSYVICNDMGDNLQQSYQNKGEAAIKQAMSFLGRFNKNILEEGKEWNAVQDNLKNREKFLHTSLTVMVVGHQSEIAKIDQSLTSLWRHNDFILSSLKYFQLPALLGFCPFLNNTSLKEIRKNYGLLRTALSSEPQALLPINAEWKGAQNGGMIMSGARGQLFTWDSFEMASNYNVVVTGMSGSGKSVWLQEYVLSQLAKDARVFVIDIGKSFEKTCKIIGGDYINFSAITNISLNPFSNIPDEIHNEQEANIVQDSLAALKFVIAKMASPKGETSNIEDSYISKSITEAYEKHGSSTNIDKLVEVLVQYQDKRSMDVALMLYEYTSKGKYGRFFNGQDNIKFSNDFTVLEFEELREKPDLGGVIMQLLTIQIVQQVYLGDRSKRFIILFDEGWYALQHFPMLLASIAKTIRKYNGGLVIGTQSLNDFYGSNGEVLSEMDKARLGVMEQCAWRVMLKQKNDSLNKAKGIGFSESQISIIKGLETIEGQYSELLICQSESEYFVARLLLDRFSQVLYSSSPKVFSRVNEYINQGISTAEAVEKVMYESFQ